MPTRLEQLEAMRAAGGADAFLLYALAMEYKGAGRRDEAVATFADLRTAHPDYVALYYQFGATLIEMGRREEAAQIVRAGKEAANKKGDAHAESELGELLSTI